MAARTVEHQPKPKGPSRTKKNLKKLQRVRDGETTIKLKFSLLRGVGVFGHCWGLVYGEGGDPGTVPLHNLRVTTHVLHQDVPLGWYQVRFF